MLSICMVDLMAIDVETSRIDSRCSMEKEFTELICMKPSMVLCQIFNQVDSHKICVHGPLI